MPTCSCFHLVVFWVFIISIWTDQDGACFTWWPLAAWVSVLLSICSASQCWYENTTRPSKKDAYSLNELGVSCLLQLLGIQRLVQSIDLYIIQLNRRQLILNKVNTFICFTYTTEYSTSFYCAIMYACSDKCEPPKRLCFQINLPLVTSKRHKNNFTWLDFQKIIYITYITELSFPCFQHVFIVT